MGAEYLEGRRALIEALDAGVCVRSVYVSDAAWRDKRVHKALKRADAAGVQVIKSTPEQLDKHSPHGAHQGVIARVASYRYAHLDELVARCSGQRDALIIVCDHIMDVGNLGAIVRTAEVVGATGVLIPNRRSARVTAAVYKSSSGALAHLPVAQEANLARCLVQLKDEGFWVVGASGHASELVWDAPLSGRIAFVVGSEDTGLSQNMFNICDLIVALPQAGRVESLNVAQATAVLAYEWMRQCRDAKRS